MDYEKIGFRGGIEIHQQINTRKLFCECPVRIRDDHPDETTKRKLHAVASELGEYDPAALHEVIRNRTFFYESYVDNVCLVELDEEPPHPVNRKALKVVMQAARMLNAMFVDEVQVMRKTVIDGSNTAGFQRTMLVATDGKIDTSEGPVNLMYFCLEEDAARIMQMDKHTVHYRLDRLGIPLLEIVTGPNFKSPKQGGEVAAKLGETIRSCNVRRGLGTIRQDVNVSTNVGTRIEIKGVQDLKLIPTIMEYEAMRQLSLYEIANELKNRTKKFTEAEALRNFRDVTDIFRGAKSAKIEQVLSDGGAVIVMKLPGFSDILKRELCPRKTLGIEFRDQVLPLGISFFLNSDEDLTGYDISEKEIKMVKDLLGIRSGDAFLLFACEDGVVEKASTKLARRAVASFDGAPKESRRALQDGNTQYMRPLPGEARMYPETDIPPVPTTPQMITDIDKNLPELRANRLERLSKKFSLPIPILKKLFDHGYLNLFENIVNKVKYDPVFVAKTLELNVVDIEKQGKSFEHVTDECFYKLFSAVRDKHLARDAMPKVLLELTKGKIVDELLEKKSAFSDDKIEHVIISVVDKKRDFIVQHGENSFKPLMGLVMKKLRGKADGSETAAVLKREIKKQLNT